MQAAQDALAAARVIILDKVSGQACLGKDAFLIGFHKKAARIAKDLRLNNHNPRQISRHKLHTASPSPKKFRIEQCPAARDYTRKGPLALSPPGAALL